MEGGPAKDRSAPTDTPKHHSGPSEAAVKAYISRLEASYFWLKYLSTSYSEWPIYQQIENLVENSVREGPKKEGLGNPAGGPSAGHSLVQRLVRMMSRLISPGSG